MSLRQQILEGTAPDNLTVRANLDLRGCTGLTQLPDNLTVRGNLYLAGCPNIQSSDRWIIPPLYPPHVGWRVIAHLTGQEYEIHAGCFRGSLPEAWVRGREEYQKPLEYIQREVSSRDVIE